VVIRVFSKLALENAPHSSPRVQNWAQYSRGIGRFPQNGTQALKGEDLCLLREGHLNG